MEPVISIVATSRNDNHGGDLTKRMRLFVNGLLYQCNKYQLPVELIIVEWNPPKNKPLLKDVLPKPEPGAYMSLRYVIVPPELHNQYVHATAIPLYQMIAKNVGIRRAQAPFILSTNIDLLFSDELMQWLKSNVLQKGYFYRASRADVPADINENDSVPEQLAWCEQKITRHWTFFSRFSHNGLLSRLVKIPWAANVLEKTINKLNTVNLSAEQQMLKLDYYACGDFTLMHYDDWLAIEGYPELDLYSIHIDSMALNACVAKGIRQVIIPSNACTYHIEHTDGWASMPALETLRFLAKRPGLDWNVVHQAGLSIIRSKSTYGLNNPNWGFADMKLEEYGFNCTN